MASRKRKIAVLGCVSSFVPSYSIAGILEDQINMLHKHKENLIFVTSDDFKDQHLVPEGVEIYYYPRYNGTFEPDTFKPLEFEQYIFECSGVLKNILSDCTHVIQHDLLFIDSFIAINWAIRECAKLLPKLKWLHWQHSGPSNMPKDCEYPMTGCYMGMDNSTFIYLNRTDIPLVAERYSIPENQIAIVHNFIDFEKRFKFHPITSELVDKYDILSADTICVYPTRLTSAKQISKIIKLFEKLKETQKVRLIICNSWSNAKSEVEYREYLSEETTLTEKELIFTSSFNSEWCMENKVDIQLGVPREVVFDLLRISDLFILPSIAECCSMIMLEAGANKNLMVLNDDLWSLHEFGGQKINGSLSTKALYLEFGSLTRTITNYNPSEEAWYREKANEIIRYQESNHAITFFKSIRKRHNPNWIYFNEIKPLLDR